MNWCLSQHFYCMSFILVQDVLVWKDLLEITLVSFQLSNDSLVEVFEKNLFLLTVLKNEDYVFVFI